MVLPLAAVGAFIREFSAYIAVAVGVGAVAIAGPELFASDQRGARELDDPGDMSAGQPANVRKQE